MMRSPSLPYVLPFAVFLALLAIMPLLRLAPRAELALWVIVLGVTLFFCRGAIDFSVNRWAGSIALGVAVFLIWIAPELAFPGYRDALPFVEERRSFPQEARADPLALALRALRAAILVPIVEELFWRSWLPRWLIRADFRSVPMGTYTRFTFLVTAVLFALEHGRYWDVGLAAGILYNAWMWRTRRLGDCILAHAVTNACLAAYVIAAGEWQYW
jgi:CAAX prenyl protease-like protein